MKIYEGVLVTVSPLHHGSPEGRARKSDDENLVVPIRAFPVSVGESYKEVYGVSGNEFKNGKLRRLIVRYTLKKLGVKPEDLPKSVVIMLFSGGKDGSGNQAKAEIKDQVRDQVPIIDLFGGIFNGHTFTSALRVGNLLAVTKETKDLWETTKDMEHLTVLVGLTEQVEKYKHFHTRMRDDETAHYDVGAEKGHTTQMAFSVEALPIKTKLAHEIVLMSEREGTQACFEAAMALFLEDGTLGGKSTVGYGRVRKEKYCVKNGSWQECEFSTEKWDAWLEKNGEKLKETLLKLPEILPSTKDERAEEAAEMIISNKDKIEKYFKKIVAFGELVPAFGFTVKEDFVEALEEHFNKNKELVKEVMKAESVEEIDALFGEEAEKKRNALQKFWKAAMEIGAGKTKAKKNGSKKQK